MITENDLADLIDQQFPQMHNELHQLSQKKNTYAILEYFANQTKRFIQIGNFQQVQTCFEIADKFLKEGNKVVQIAVENSYLYVIELLLDESSATAKKVKALLPQNLKKLRLNHIYSN